MRAKGFAHNIIFPQKEGIILQYVGPSNVRRLKESYITTFEGKYSCHKGPYIDRVQYFSYLTKTPFSLILQIWQLYSVLDTLSPFWSHK